MPNALPPLRAALEQRLGVDKGTLTGADAERADAALGDATTLALAEVPSTTASTWRTDAPDVVVLVILKAARREFDNPEGIAQEALGGRSVSGMDKSGVFLTDREVRMVRRAANGRKSFVGTVYTPSAYWPTGYVRQMETTDAQIEAGYP